LPVFYRDVKAELEEFGRKPRRYPRLTMSTPEVHPWVGMKSLMFKTVVEGETDKYVTSIQFYDIEFNEDKTKRCTEMIEIQSARKKKVKGKAKGETFILFHEKPSKKNHPVALKCECPDFRFRFEKELFDHDGLIGATFRKYTRKTPPPPEGYPYANPEELMGFCKHLNSLIANLKDLQKIKD
jgi:hypothetical protein